VPPPLITDITTTLYRENLAEVIQPFTDHYEMFSEFFETKTGKRYSFDAPHPELSKPPMKSPASPKIKVTNLMFLAYTMYNQMTQIFKLFGEEVLNHEKAGSAFAIIRRKVEEFYRDTNEIKIDYQRLKVIHLLEREIEFLELSTKNINCKVDAIQHYVELNAAEKCGENGKIPEEG
jgi:hypothetical protein